MANITKILEESLTMDIIERLFFLIRKREKSNDELIDENLTNAINETVNKARKIYRIDYWDSMYFNNEPLLIGDTKLLSISLFLMSVDEWKSQFEKDIKYTHLKGTDARSIRDMIKACFELGLERSNQSSFFSFYSYQIIDYKQINKWIYSDFDIYKEVVDKDYSIVTLEEVIKRKKNKNPLLLSNKLTQNQLLSLIKNYLEQYGTSNYNNTFFRAFIQECTVYKNNVSKNYYLKIEIGLEKQKFNLSTEELSDFMGLLKFLNDEAIFDRFNASRLYETLKQSFPDIENCIKSTKFRNELYKNANLSKEVKSDLRISLDKMN